MSLIIARFLLSRLESLSALLQVFQIFRGRADVLPAFLRVVSSRYRVSSQHGAAKTGETVCFVPLRYRSIPQTPQTRRRSHQPCCVVLLSAPQYPWRKDPHLPSQPPSSATCRARTGLPPMPFVDGFRICSRRCETRLQIPQAKENSHASACSVPDPHLPPDGRAGLYTYITVRKSWPDFLRGPSELPLCLRLIIYMDTLYAYPFRQALFPGTVPAFRIDEEVSQMYLVLVEVQPGGVFIVLDREYDLSIVIDGADMVAEFSAMATVAWCGELDLSYDP